jgi:phosphoribosylamine-glycine ligase
VKLIEYNARLGDPEVFNLLTLMKSDLVDLCIHITQQTLNTFALEFLPQASVCKYIVPQ